MQYLNKQGCAAHKSSLIYGCTKLRFYYLSLCVDLCSHSEKRNCEQANPLLVGLQQHKQASLLVALDERYGSASAVGMWSAVDEIME